MIQLLNIVYLLYYLLSTNLSPLTCVKIQHLLCRYQHGQELLNATVHLFNIKVECGGKKSLLHRVQSLCDNAGDTAAVLVVITLSRG